MDRVREAGKCFSDLLQKLTFRAVRLLIDFETRIPPDLKTSKSRYYPREAREEFLTEIFKQEFDETYTTEEIASCRNILNGDELIQRQLGKTFDLKEVLSRFKAKNPQHPYVENLNALSLLPFRTTCKECGNRLKPPEFHMTAYVVYPTSIEPCTLYNAECKQCKLSYRVSSIYDNNSFIVTPESLDKSRYFHLSFGKIVFSRELLVSFSSDLVDGHVSFNAAATALLSKIDRIHSTSLRTQIDHTYLSRSLEAHWTYYEMSNFVFMTSSETQINFPRAVCSGICLFLTAALRVNFISAEFTGEAFRNHTKRVRI
ncbi:unnamed protein product [Sphagnum troendelagicum]